MSWVDDRGRHRISVAHRFGDRQETKRGHSGLSLLVALLLWGGCVLFQPWQLIYLKDAKNHATKDDVQRRFGAPRFTRLLSTGETEWAYRVWSYDAGDLNRPASSWCDKYTLFFDDGAILRRWMKEGC